MPDKTTGWGFLKRRDDVSLKASEIYGRLVAQARCPSFYALQGAPDTAEGRLEMINLHMVVVLRRLRDPATAELSRAVSETFVTDMDDCMREMGVGDMMVAKKVKKAAGALWERISAYGAALDARDTSRLALLIEQHVVQGAESPAIHASPGAEAIANYMLDADQRVRAAPVAALHQAVTPFPPAPGA